MRYFGIDYSYLGTYLFFIGILAWICQKERQDLYRSIICFVVTMLSGSQILSNVLNGTLMDPYQFNDTIKIVNHIMTAYFIIDTYLLFLYKSNRISLWIHHIWCLFFYITNINFYHLTTGSFGECVTIIYLLKLRNEQLFIFYNNIYRLIVFIGIRIPLWLFCLYFSYINFDNYGRFYLAKITIIITPLLLISLDISWINANIDIIFKNAVEYFEGDLSKISKTLKRIKKNK